MDSASAVLAATVDPDKALRSYRAEEYPRRVAYCVAGFIGLVSFCHFISVAVGAFNSFYKAKRLRKDGNASTAPQQGLERSGRLHRRGVVNVRRLPKAALHAYRALAFRWTVDFGKSYRLNMAELVLTTAYIVLVFAWSLTDSTSLTGVKFDPKYWANRAGNIAASQVTLTTLLGMKNNPLSLLTGMSCEQLNFLHRMTARVLLVLIWLHGAGRIYISYDGGVAMSHAWVQSGILGASALALLAIVSVRPLRERNYEYFRVAHLIFGGTFIIAGYLHAHGFEEEYYIMPSLVLWGFDRFLRGMRLIMFNFGYFKPAGAEELDAKIDILSPHFMRIRLERPRHFFWTPGQNAYLTVPAITSFQSHPFTISSVCMPTPGESNSSGEVTHGDEEKQPDLRDTSLDTLDRMALGRTVMFMVRVHGGFTQRLMHLAERKQRMRLFLDGPYGAPPSFQGFSTVVFVAGGSGIAFTLPLFLNLVSRVQQGKPSCKRIVFVWVIRESNNIRWIIDSLMLAIQNVPSSLSLNLKMFVTTCPSETDSFSTADSEAKSHNPKTDSAILSSPFIHIHQGRPDIEVLLKEELENSDGEVSVSVCGPDGLAQSTRRALRAPRFMAVLKGGPAVSLHVEGFGYA